MSKQIKISFIVIILFSIIYSRESMITNFHFHRLSDGSVIVHSHFNSVKHNHTKKEIVILDKYYTAISKIEDNFNITENFKETNKTKYLFIEKRLDYIFSNYVYDHYP